LHVDGPSASADLIRRILQGEACSARRVVLANTAAALLAANRVRSLTEGVELAAQSIDSGGARRVLEALISGHG
jgi:anthranilate phosphoribosyltransferase